MRKIVLSFILLVFILFLGNVFAENMNIWPLICNIESNNTLNINTYPDNALFNDLSNIFIVYWHNNIQDWEWYNFINKWIVYKESFNTLDKEEYYNKRDEVLKNNNIEYSYGNFTKLLKGYYFNEFNFNVNNENINIRGNNSDERVHIKYLDNIYNIEWKIYNIKNIDWELVFVLVKKDWYEINVLWLNCWIENVKKDSNKNIIIKKLNKIKETEKFDYIDWFWNLIYSEKINSFAFIWWNWWEHTLIKDFKEVKFVNSNNNEQIIRIFFSEDWKSFSYILHKGSNYYNIINWLETKMEWNVLDILNKYNDDIYNAKSENIKFKWNFIKKVYDESTWWEYKFYFEKDWYKSELYDSIIRSEHIIFSKNNNDFAFWGEKDWNYILNKNGEEILSLDKAYNRIYKGKIWTYYSNQFLYISDNWENLAYIKWKNWKKVAILDWYETGEYDEIWSVVISGDWKELLLSVKKDWKVFVVKYSINKEEYNNNNVEIKLELTKQLILSKIKLKDTKWNKYVDKFEELIPKLSDEKLVILSDKLEKFDLNNIKFAKYKDILSYLKLKIELEILKSYIE